MACKNCKNKEEFSEEFINSIAETPKNIIWGVIIMVLFSIYGFFSFISDFINIFL